MYTARPRWYAYDQQATEGIWPQSPVWVGTVRLNNKLNETSIIELIRCIQPDAGGIPVISKPLGVSGPNLLDGLIQYILGQQLVHDPIYKP